MQKQFSLFLSTTPILSPSLVHPNQAKIRVVIGTCCASDYITGKSGSCTALYNDSCCQEGQLNPRYRCSPPVTAKTDAIMYIASFGQAVSSSLVSSCGGEYYADHEPVVMLLTGRYNSGFRGLKNISITANGNSMLPKVVDECDSLNGCTAELGYQKPCGPNEILVSLIKVWEGLNIADGQIIGGLKVTWSDVSSS